MIGGLDDVEGVFSKLMHYILINQERYKDDKLSSVLILMVLLMCFKNIEKVTGNCGIFKISTVLAQSIH